MNIKLNASVITPNGPGVAWGRFSDQRISDGILYILVQHNITKMTSQERGLKVTPKAVIRGLWAYPEEEVTVNE